MSFNETVLAKKPLLVQNFHNVFFIIAGYEIGTNWVFVKKKKHAGVMAERPLSPFVGKHRIINNPS